jgi:glycosyltransferase involved in cell wall biosynthesis
MNSNPQPLVSIATPVYNGEKYIQACIESVLAQTYQNWEYVIVNNCSTDRTLEIITRYTERTPKIKVYNNDRFLTSLQNQNKVVKSISPESKYCKVLHADDWLFPSCLEMMVRVNEAHPSVGLVGSYGLAVDRVVGDGLPYETEIVCGRELARLALLKQIRPFPSPSSLLIRSEIVRNRDPFYDEENIHADHKVCYQILREYDFGFVHQVLTYIRKHDESITSSMALPLDMFRLTDLDLLTRYGPEFLMQAEFEEQLRKRFSVYYRLMARRFIEQREKAYWKYHQQGLKKLGYRFSLLRVLYETFREAVLRPTSTLKTMYQSTKRSTIPAR